jgi:hypothetical protein
MIEGDRAAGHQTELVVLPVASIARNDNRRVDPVPSPHCLNLVSFG